MGLFGKFKFGKKDDLDKELGDLGMDPGLPSQQNIGADPLGLPQQNSGQDPMGQGDYMSDPLSKGFSDTPKFGTQPNTFDQGFGRPPARTDIPSSAPFSQTPQQSSESPELRVISAKLDAIKATMDAINQRLSNLEQYSYDKKRREGW